MKKNKEISLEDPVSFLLSTSLKIKDIEDFYYFVKAYMANFEKTIDFAIYLKENDITEFYDGHLSLETNEISDEINSYQFPENCVGEVFYSTNRKNVFIPVYVDESQYEILVIGKDEQEAIALSNIFLMNIKNIHIYRQLKKKTHELINLANTDEVTGLYNQRRLTSDLEITIEEHKRSEKSFSLMFIDVDHFKKVNDVYGHVIGSELLTLLGQELKSHLRGSDDVYRYGGDEFIAIMRNVEIKVVRDIALRILKKLKATEFKLSNGDLYRLSISIGIAEYPTDAQTALDIIRFADEMMYESKQSGRGKVFHLGTEVKDVDSSSE